MHKSSLGKYKLAADWRQKERIRIKRRQAKNRFQQLTKRRITDMDFIEQSLPTVGEQEPSDDGANQQVTRKVLSDFEISEAAEFDSTEKLESSEKEKGNDEDVSVKEEEKPKPAVNNGRGGRVKGGAKPASVKEKEQQKILKSSEEDPVSDDADYDYDPRDDDKQMRPVRTCTRKSDRGATKSGGGQGRPKRAQKIKSSGVEKDGSEVEKVGPTKRVKTKSKGGRGRPKRAQNTKSIRSENEHSGEYFIVDKIMDKRTIGREVQYYLSWKGYDESHNTWEPKRNMNCRALIVEFEKKLKDKKISGIRPKTNAIAASPAKGKYRPGPASTMKQGMKRQKIHVE